MFISQLVGFLVLLGLTTAQNCAAAAKCKTPAEDLKTLTLCQLTSLFDSNGLTTIAQLLSQQTCNESTIEDIGSNFMGTLTKGATGPTLTKLSGAIAPFTFCLSSKGSNLNKAVAQIGTAFKNALGTMYTNLQTPIVKNFKNKCTTQAMYTAVYKNFCPKYTTALIQKVVEATKIQMGNSWPCVPTKLSPNVLNLTTYKV